MSTAASVHPHRVAAASLPESSGEGPQKPVVRTVLDGLDPSQFPRLTRLLEGRGGAALRRELEVLLHVGRQSRAERRRRRVFATLLHSGTGAEETVLVRDVSATGILLSVPRAFGADAAADWRVVLRARCGVEESDTLLTLRAELVRVAARFPEYLDIAFQFAGLSAEETASLDRLRSLWPDLGADVPAPRGPLRTRWVTLPGT